MKFRVKTSNPTGAALRGVGVGVIAVGIMLAVGVYFGLPLDAPRFVAVFVVGCIWGVVFSYEKSPKRGRDARPPVEVLLQGVAWDFSATVPDDLETFVAKVRDSQSDPTRWSPDRPIEGTGPLTILFYRFWAKDGESEARFVLDPPDNTSWTYGNLLHAIHKHLQSQGDLGDHSFFEGLLPQGPQQYRLLLGS